MTAPLKNGNELDKALKECDKVIVLFYASWCPFSQRFLPIFEKYAAKKKSAYLRVEINDDESLADKYDVNVYPTVLFFEGGKVSKRLDGMAGVGLSEDHLTDFIVTCRV